MPSIAVKRDVCASQKVHWQLGTLAPQSPLKEIFGRLSAGAINNVNIEICRGSFDHHECVNRKLSFAVLNVVMCLMCHSRRQSVKRPLGPETKIWL